MKYVVFYVHTWIIFTNEKFKKTQRFFFTKKPSNQQYREHGQLLMDERERR